MSSDNRLKTLKRLPPCPCCKGNRYQYGFSGMKELAPDLAKVGLAAITGNVALVVQGGLPFLGVIQAFKHAVFDDIPETPLLRCRHCSNYVLICPNCLQPLLAETYPSTGTLLRCGSCQRSFGSCERFIESNCKRLLAAK